MFQIKKILGFFSALFETLTTLYLLYLLFLFLWSTFSYLIPHLDRFLAASITFGVALYLYRGWFLSFLNPREG
jgi:hypothetical protein